MCGLSFEQEHHAVVRTYSESLCLYGITNTESTDRQRKAVTVLRGGGLTVVVSVGSRKPAMGHHGISRSDPLYCV